LNKKGKAEINWTALLTIIVVVAGLYFWWQTSPKTYDGFMTGIGFEQQNAGGAVHE